jgi:surface protein
MTIITNENIRRLVNAFISGERALKRIDAEDLVGVPIGKWDVSGVTIMDNLFENQFEFNEDIGDWDVSNVTSMSRMFINASKFNQDISRWNVSNVTNMISMFFFAQEFNQDISGWVVSKVTDMTNMFHGAKKFNQNISNWDVSKVRNIRSIFEGATNFDQDLSNWKLVGLRLSQKDEIIYVRRMFKGSEMFDKTKQFPKFIPAPPSVHATRAVQEALNALDNNVLIDKKNGSLLANDSLHLRANDDYKPEGMPATQFRVSQNKISRDSTYVDLIDGEDKNILETLTADQSAFVFNLKNNLINKSINNYLVLQLTDLVKMMNDPDIIKYECKRVSNPGDGFPETVRTIPYISINNLGMDERGVVPLFDLWSAINSGTRMYEVVRTNRELPSIASHHVLYCHGPNISHVSASHCQEGQNVFVYEIKEMQSAVNGGRRRPRSKHSAKKRTVKRNRRAGHKTRAGRKSRRTRR